MRFNVTTSSRFNVTTKQEPTSFDYRFLVNEAPFKRLSGLFADFELHLHLLENRSKKKPVEVKINEASDIFKYTNSEFANYGTSEPRNFEFSNSETQEFSTLSLVRFANSFQRV